MSLRISMCIPNNLHIVFIGAHPDDEGYCVGTLAKYAQSGHKVTLVCATGGGKGHYEIPSTKLRKIRKNELRNVGKLIKADVLFLDYQDGSIPPPYIIRDDLITLIRRLRPDIMITWHPYTDRDDHRYIGQGIIDACFKANLPLIKTNNSFSKMPMIYLIGEPSFPSSPDYYIDISNQIELKIKAIKQHKSQVLEWIPWIWSQNTQGKIKPDLDTIIKYFVIERAKTHGLASGVKYAEEFRVIKNISPDNQAREFLPSNEYF